MNGNLAHEIGRQQVAQSRKASTRRKSQCRTIQKSLLEKQSAVDDPFQISQSISHSHFKEKPFLALLLHMGAL